MKQGYIEREKEMYALITRWENSGLNQKAFCKAERVNYYKFKYWRTRRNQQLQPKEKAKPSPLLPSKSFVPIEITNTLSVFTGLQVHFPNGVKLICSAGMSENQIKTLIHIF